MINSLNIQNKQKIVVFTINWWRYPK